MFRDTLIMTEEQTVIAKEYYDKAMKIRTFLPFGMPVGINRKDGFTTFSCHAVAHAFSQVFGLEVVDGELAYITKTTLRPARFLRQETIDVWWKFIKHSWIEIDIHGCRFILDIFPMEICSLLPLFLSHPHPAYYVPQEKKHEELFKAKLDSPEFKEEVISLVSVMEKIICDQNLKPHW